MGIIWDPAKHAWLVRHRGISLDEVAGCILRKEYKAVLENPSRPGQMVFVLEYKGYTHVAPFVVDAEKNIVLKTVFPSRRFHRLYGGGDHEEARA